MRHCSWSAVFLLTVAVLGCGAALYVLQLHLLIGPAQQPINIRWAPGTSEVARRTAETTLELRDGEELGRGRWVYHRQDHSREALRQIVTHPLIADTNHVNRQAFRLVIDAPALPAWLRRVLEFDLGPTISLTAAVIGFVAFWFARRELSMFFNIVRAFPGLEQAIALALLCIGFGLFYDNGQGVDENVHYDQIVRLATGHWSLNRSVNPSAPSMLPGFHVIVAGLVWAAGGASEFSVRLAVFLLSVATVGAFHALARTLQPEQAGTRTLQFTVLPILFPQFFLIYTDVTSLLFVLLMMLATARRKYWAAGVLGLVSCLVRQDNVIWMAFAVLWSYLRDHGWTWRPLSQSLTRYWTFVATGVGFLLFVSVNGGQVALGKDAGKHPLGAVYFTNIFFLLFLSCFLFLPLWWGYRRDVLARIRSQWPWLSLLGLFLIFWLGFVNDHPDNNKRPEFFLRNAVLMLFSSSTILKLLFFVPVAASALCMTAVPMRKPWWLLYPFTILFLLPEWLVEQRYYLIPLSLFLLAREPTASWSERFQTILFIMGSAGLFLMVERMGRWM